MKLGSIPARLLELLVPRASAAAHCVFCAPRCRPDGVLEMWCLNQCTDEQYSGGVIGSCEPPK
ncbi:MAG TPA: hypothetical protein VGF17_07100 [Phytomonospora sp.]